MTLARQRMVPVRPSQRGQARRLLKVMLGTPPSCNGMTPPRIGSCRGAVAVVEVPQWWRHRHVPPVVGGCQHWGLRRGGLFHAPPGEVRSPRWGCASPAGGPSRPPPPAPPSPSLGRRWRRDARPSPRWVYGPQHPNRGCGGLGARGQPPRCSALGLCRCPVSPPPASPGASATCGDTTVESPSPCGAGTMCLEKASPAGKM